MHRVCVKARVGLLGELEAAFVLGLLRHAGIADHAIL
jgi:hypothetical protein